MGDTRSYKPRANAFISNGFIASYQTHTIGVNVLVVGKHLKISTCLNYLCKTPQNFTVELLLNTRQILRISNHLDILGPVEAMPAINIYLLQLFFFLKISGGYTTNISSCKSLRSVSLWNTNKNITPVFDDPYPTKLVTKQFHLLSDVMKLKYLETLRVDIQYRSSFKPIDLVMDQMLAINKCNFSLNTFSI